MIHLPTAHQIPIPNRPGVVVLLNELRIIQPVIARRPVIQSQSRILSPVVIRPVPDQMIGDN